MTLWTKDRSGFSWHAKDADGTFYRISRVICNGAWCWILAWQESNGLRICSSAVDDLDAMKLRAESLMTMADAESCVGEYAAETKKEG